MATESIPPDDVPDVQGLDTAAGLERVAGNRKLYLKLLRRYIDGQSSAAQSLRACLSSGDRKTAERIADNTEQIAKNTDPANGS